MHMQNSIDHADLLLHAGESYERKALQEHPEILDRVLMTYESESAKEIRARIFQVFDLADRVCGMSKPVAPGDDSSLRHLLLFAWPESGEIAFMGVTSAELSRHRLKLRSTVTGDKGHIGDGHIYMFANRAEARKVIKHLHTYYASRDPRAWPVWGLSPTGNYWSVNGRSIAEAFRTD